MRTSIVTVVLVAASLGLGLLPARADLGLIFVPHGAYFSDQTRQDPPVDPQVFVRDPRAPEGTGPQGIHHVAGLRPVSLVDDDRTQRLYNAEGRPLGVTLGAWLNASGTAALADTDRLHVGFTGLIPSARYTVSISGKDASDTFTASPTGTATVDVVMTAPIESGDAVVLAYHSDQAAPPESGVNMHDQLILINREP